MEAIKTRARAAGVHTLIGGTGHANAAGPAFHATCGYDEIARLPEVGFTFKRWYDLVLMQKRL